MCPRSRGRASGKKGKNPRSHHQHRVGEGCRARVRRTAPCRAQLAACSTVAVLRLVMPVLQWGFVRHAAQATLNDWFRSRTGVTPVKFGAAVPRCLMRDHRQRRHGRAGQHRRRVRVLGEGRCAGQGGAGPGDGAAPQRADGAGLRAGAGAGSEGELLVPGGGGRARQPVPDAGSAAQLPVGLEATARGAAGPGAGVAAVRCR